MNENLGLGESDAEARWIGVRRHQAVLVILGVGLASDWVMSPRAPLLVIVAGLALAMGAVPCYDGLTVGEGCVVALRYLLRSHWHDLNVRELGDDVVLWAIGEVALRGYELTHRGRLDLSGRDVTIAEGLAALADASSAARTGQHFSQHVVTKGADTLTMLTLPLDVAASLPTRCTARAARRWALAPATTSTCRAKSSVVDDRRRCSRRPREGGTAEKSRTR